MIVTDKLDHYQPKYTNILLELIKHFFGVLNLYFILYVKLYELKNSQTAQQMLQACICRVLQH